MTMQQLMMGGGGSNTLVGTFDPANKGAYVTLSNGNLTAANNAASSFSSVISTNSISTGLDYLEFVLAGSSGYMAIGVGNSSTNLNDLLGADAASIAYRPFTGQVITNGLPFTTLATAGNGDLIGMKVNLTAGTIEFNKNGGSFSSTFPLPSGAMFFAASVYYGHSVAVNLKPTYTIPSSYVYWGN